MKSKAKTATGTENSTGPRLSALKGGDANCVVSKGTTIEGDFLSSENIRLDGGVNGQLKCEKRLVVGETGRVEGKVEAAEAVIMGQVKGNVSVSGTLHLMGTAKIEGDISAHFLTVEEGAAYNGKCQVGGQ